jgi:transcriptional regulator with XRE-family HTH domain
MAARAHRVGLGLTPEQVAEGMAAHGVRLLPSHVLGWESGEIRPSEEEFIALARALWCPPAQLMGARPSTLRDFRVARELSQEQAARRIGVTTRAYEQAEATGKWSGDGEQTYALAQVLGIGLRALLRVTNRQDELDLRLKQVVDGRWQAQLKAVGRLARPRPPRSSRRASRSPSASGSCSRGTRPASRPDASAGRRPPGRSLPVAGRPSEEWTGHLRSP